MVAGGTLDLPAQLIDVRSGTTQPLGPLQDLRAMTSAGAGRAHRDHRRCAMRGLFALVAG